MVEQWFVEPKVLGSNPRLHPYIYPHTTKIVVCESLSFEVYLQRLFE